MPRATVCRKRPCRVCRRWFIPNPRLKDRQMTCGDPECKSEWHRRKCAEWNRNNPDYFKENYLQKKLDAAIPSDSASRSLPPKSRVKSGLPLGYIQEVIGIQHLIIIEYFGQLLLKRFQEVIKFQLIENTKQTRRLSGFGVQEVIDFKWGGDISSFSSKRCYDDQEKDPRSQTNQKD